MNPCHVYTPTNKQERISKWNIPISTLSPLNNSNRNFVNAQNIIHKIHLMKEKNTI